MLSVKGQADVTWICARLLVLNSFVMIRQDIDVIEIPENVQTTTTECVVIYVFRRVQRYDLGWRFSARGVWDRLTRYHTELGRRDFSIL